MMKLPHARPGQRLTRSAWNRMVDAVNAANNLVVRGAARMTRDNRGATIQIKGGGDDKDLRRAKAQEAGQADGELSVKFVDSSGAAIGNAFDVYAFMDQGATDMSGYLPAIALNDIIAIKKIQGVWYMDWTPNAFTAITVQTTMQVDGANSELENKTRANVKVFGADAESGWAVIHTGTVCP